MTTQTTVPAPTGQPEPAPAASDAQWTAARTEVTGEIRQTDAKAGALLSALAVTVAVLTATVQGRSLTGAATALVWLGGGALVVALVMVLLAICPMLGPAEGARGSFLYWAECLPEQLVADLATDRRAERIQTLSRIARRKHRLLRRAIHLTIGALVPLLGALVAGLL
ncbi:Pycsar system effector family protein [Kitasatospora purpeofusca]|uniref:Pycsar system effector family protein n=1 Tax=Kitasatospora purpeofusca TaxID=67352 RepID=UPI0035D8BB42